METGATITAAVFAAYLKCPTKAYLTAHGEKPPDATFAEMRERIPAAYKALASQRLPTASTGPIDFARLADGVIGDAGTAFVDCETVSYTTESSALASVESAG